jgi:hypothetical protein
MNLDDHTCVQNVEVPTQVSYALICTIFKKRFEFKFPYSIKVHNTKHCRYTVMVLWRHCSLYSDTRGVTLITQVRLQDMWGPRLQISSLRTREGCPAFVSVPGYVYGLIPGLFLWCRSLDLLCLVATLPLVGGDVEGLHYRLHRPTNYNWQMRVQS